MARTSVHRRLRAAHLRQIAGQLERAAKVLESDRPDDQVAAIETWGKRVVDAARRVGKGQQHRIWFMRCLDDALAENPDADASDIATDALRQFTFAYPEWIDKADETTMQLAVDAVRAWSQNRRKYHAVLAVFRAMGDRRADDPKTLGRDYRAARAWWSLLNG